MKALKQNGIPRNPEAPDLDDESIKLLTQLCFRQDDKTERVDLIFVYGTATCSIAKRMARVVLDLLNKNVCDKVIITGGFTNKSDTKKFSKAESDLLIDEIDVDKYNRVEFIIENKSFNMLENVTEALRILDFSNYKKILFIFKSHAAGRGYLTLRKYLPKTEILQKTFNTKYSKAELEINRDNWHTFDFGRSRVWGEFLRIRKYGQRGDIEFDEVKDLVRQIDRLTY